MFDLSLGWAYSSSTHPLDCVPRIVVVIIIIIILYVYYVQAWILYIISIQDISDEKAISTLLRYDRCFWSATGTRRNSTITLYHIGLNGCNMDTKLQDT